MTHTTWRRLLTAILSGLMLLTLCAGCAKEPAESTPASGDASADSSSASLPDADSGETPSGDADSSLPSDSGDSASDVGGGQSGNADSSTSGGNTTKPGGNTPGSKPDSSVPASTTTSTKGGGSSNTPSTGGFSLPTTGLTAKTVYRVAKTAIVNPGKGIMQHDSARLICSLQGLLNRDLTKNKIAMYLDYDDTDSFWVNQLQSGLFSGYKTVTISTFSEFLSTFKNQLVACGMCLWDQDVPSTANVAATICGVEGYLPVKYDTADNGLMKKLQDMGVKSRLSLRGKFTGKGVIQGTKIVSTGSKKCDAYLWAMDKYMDRTSKKIIAYMPDGAGCVETNEIYKKDSDAGTAYGNNIFDHDYLIAAGAFFFDLSPVETEVPCDDKTQQVGTDLKTLRRILQRQYTRNNGAFSQIIGFPPWWIKYTNHNNWGSLPATTVEWMFTDIATQYNLAKEADAAQPCCMTNASVYTHAPLSGSFKNTNRKTNITEKFDKNTVYLLYYMGDYDSSAWLKKWVPTLWSDSGKGKMPMMWSFNPNLSDRMPAAFNYVYSHMDKNDYFVSGDSGPGYIIPGGLYQSTCPNRPNPDGNKAWISYAKTYMKKFDMDIVGFIINGSYKMNKTIMADYNQIAPVGSFHNDPSKPLTVVNGVPYVYLKNGVGNPGSYQNSAKDMYAYLKNNMNGYNFGAFRTICWTPSQINALSDAFIAYAKTQDPSKTYKFVDPYTYFAMIRQSGQGA